ncbi:MAG: hypothetical protein WCI20_06860 [bacterium]
MNYCTVAIALVVSAAATTSTIAGEVKGPIQAGPVSQGFQAEAKPKQKYEIKFRDAPVERMLAYYGEMTGLTLLCSPRLPLNKVTLEGKNLPLDELCGMIETALKEQGVLIVRPGATFAIVVSATEEMKPEGLDQLVPATVTINVPGVASMVEYQSAPVEVILQDYANWAGKTMFVSKDISRVPVSLRSQRKLTQQECLQAIDNVLLLHGIKLIVLGDGGLGAIPAISPESNRQEVISALIPLSSMQNGLGLAKDPKEPGANRVVDWRLVSIQTSGDGAGRVGLLNIKTKQTMSLGEGETSNGVSVIKIDVEHEKAQLQFETNGFPSIIGESKKMDR